MTPELKARIEEIDKRWDKPLPPENFLTQMSEDTSFLISELRRAHEALSLAKTLGSCYCEDLARMRSSSPCTTCVTRKEIDRILEDDSRSAHVGG